MRMSVLALLGHMQKTKSFACLVDICANCGVLLASVLLRRAPNSCKDALGPSEQRRGAARAQEAAGKGGRRADRAAVPGGRGAGHPGGQGRPGAPGQAWVPPEAAQMVACGIPTFPVSRVIGCAQPAALLWLMGRSSASRGACMLHAEACTACCSCRHAPTPSGLMAGSGSGLRWRPWRLA